MSGAVILVNSVRKLGNLASTVLNHSSNAPHSDENEVSIKPNLNVTGAHSLFKRGRGWGGASISYHIEKGVGQNSRLPDYGEVRTGRSFSGTYRS